VLWPAGVVDCLPRHCRTDWNLGPAKGPHESSRIKHVQLRPWVTLAMSWPRWRQAQARYVVPKRWSILSRKLCWRLSIMVKTPVRYWLERIWKLRIQHHRQKCPFTILHWFFSPTTKQLQLKHLTGRHTKIKDPDCWTTLSIAKSSSSSNPPTVSKAREPRAPSKTNHEGDVRYLYIYTIIVVYYIYHYYYHCSYYNHYYYFMIITSSSSNSSR